MKPVTKYSVIQYVPDPIADERLNIGLLAWRERRICVEFLAGWDRIARIADQVDLSLLREFSDELSSEVYRLNSAAGGMLPDDEAMNRLLDNARKSVHLVQFTPERGSLDDPSAVVSNLRHIFLKEPTTTPRLVVRDRETVASNMMSSLRRAFQSRVHSYVPEALVHRNPSRLKGQLIERPHVDVAVSNGVLYAASQALSFQVRDAQKLRWQESLLVLNDLRLAHPDIMLSVIVAPPDTRTKTGSRAQPVFEDTRRSAERAGIPMITEDEIADWSSELAGVVADRLDRPRAETSMADDVFVPEFARRVN